MINIIVAMDQNNGIGKDNKLLIHLKEDLKYFQNVTKGHTVVMGRKTYEGLPNKPLKDRENIVLTKENKTFNGAKVVHNVQDILEFAQNEEVFICGGQSIYEQFMPYADKLYITHLFSKFEADTFFPKIDESWEIETLTATKEMLQNSVQYVFAVYKRKNS